MHVCDRCTVQSVRTVDSILQLLLCISVCTALYFISTCCFSALTQLAGCKDAEKGQMGEEDGSFRHHQLEEVGALAVWGGGSGSECVGRVGDCDPWSYVRPSVRH